MYRWSDLDFEANVKDGHGVDWPIRYQDVAPWYSHVEKFIGVSGQAEQLPQLPDSEFLPPMELTAGEKALKEAIEQTFPERTLTIGRAAVLTQPHNGRGACHYCGPCSRGCSVGAYFSSLSSTLPAARKTGNMTLRAGTVVHSLVYDPETSHVTGVRVVDRETKDVREVHGRLVFLCASTLGSTQILLNAFAISTAPTLTDSASYGATATRGRLSVRRCREPAAGRGRARPSRRAFGSRGRGLQISACGARRSRRRPTALRSQTRPTPTAFRTDGACMASSACQNPSLTYMALTARAADYAVKQMKRGDLRG